MTSKNAALIGLFAFLLLSFALVVTVALPMMDKDLYVASKAAPDYSKDPLAVEGRKIYQREGCWFCHTQQVRTIPNDNAFQSPAKRPTEPSDYGHDNPALLGTERTGPDLKYVGHRWPDVQWHIDHLRDPRKVGDPASVMPSFAGLSDSDLNALAHYLVMLKDWSVADLAKRARTSKEADIPKEYTDAKAPFDLNDPNIIAQGKEVFTAKACWSCHGKNADGTGNLNLNPPPANLHYAAEQRSTTFLYWIISEGSKDATTATAMPAWKNQNVSETDRWKLAAYVKSLPPLDASNPCAKTYDCKVK